jgi:hypothetical protein
VTASSPATYPIHDIQVIAAGNGVVAVVVLVLVVLVVVNKSKD